MLKKRIRKGWTTKSYDEIMKEELEGKGNAANKGHYLCSEAIHTDCYPVAQGATPQCTGVSRHPCRKVMISRTIGIRKIT